MNVHPQLLHLVSVMSKLFTKLIDNISRACLCFSSTTWFYTQTKKKSWDALPSHPWPNIRFIGVFSLLLAGGWHYHASSCWFSWLWRSSQYNKLHSDQSRLALYPFTAKKIHFSFFWQRIWSSCACRHLNWTWFQSQRKNSCSCQRPDLAALGFVEAVVLLVLLFQRV